jgi:uncharacterized protein YaiE (UPF0345 family)
MDSIENARILLKANVYFDGKVVSHTIHVAGGRKTVGLIYPGSYGFDTAAPERMDILAGECKVRRTGETEWTVYRAGQHFQVPGRSRFEISVDHGIAEYLCSFE